MTIADLPHVNAALNSISAILIVLGYVFIRRKRVSAHRACMIGATIVSAFFLTSYLVYHYSAGHTRFAQTGVVKIVYLLILFSHIALAVAVPVLVALALYRAFRNEIERHRKIVKWAFPIWLYVSVTGVLVYLMLYHLYPARAV